jgi:nucleoside-diphosphate-sugar epimerase
MRVLVTGGSGFLGINMIRKLLINGIKDIIVLDIADFNYPEKEKLVFVNGDIRDKSKVRKSMIGCTHVIHTAAALPLYSKQNIMTTDVDGTRNLLEEAEKQKIERFVHISSTAVYGIPDHYPLLETDKLQGVGAYGNAKILAEEVCIEFRKKGLIVPIIRPKSFIGKERLGVFALFYDWAKDGKGFPMIGSGKNRYQLLDVEDLCDFIWLCMIMESEIVNDTFNIGAKVFSTMKEDYQAVLDCAGYGKKIIGFPALPVIWGLRILEFFHLSPLYKWVYESACKDSFVSIEKAEKNIGFIPKYSNKDALISNYKWYIKNADNFKNISGISHRVPWKQGILKFVKIFF